MMKFQKAPAHMGKVLTLFVGNGDKRILDSDVLEGAYWQKFVGLGFLVPVDDEASAPPPAVPYVPPKAEVLPEKAPDPVFVTDSASDSESKGTMTRSGADKMAKAQGAKGTSTSTRHKGKRRKK